MAWVGTTAVSSAPRACFADIVRQQEQRDEIPESHGPPDEAPTVCAPAPVVLSQEEDDLALAFALQAIDASDDADARTEYQLRLDSARSAGLPEPKIKVKVTKPGISQPAHARAPTMVYSERIYRIEGEISVRSCKGKPKEF